MDRNAFGVPDIKRRKVVRCDAGEWGIVVIIVMAVAVAGILFPAGR